MRHYSTCKLLLLVALIMAWTSVSAQTYKTVKSWDLTTWSEATIANWEADTDNWTAVTAVVDGATVVQRYKNKVTFGDAQELKANANVISETEGLLFSNKFTANNLTIRFAHSDNGIQLGKDGPVTIKGLKAGQRVTVYLRSASTDPVAGLRGIASVSANLSGSVGESTYKVGPEDNYYTFSVTADGDGSFTNGGGIILKSILVEEEATTPTVAFVYDSTYATHDLTTDPIYAALVGVYDVTLIDVNGKDASIVEGLKTYDLVYSAEAVSSTHAVGLALKSIVGQVPMLNQKSFYYASDKGRWAWGAGVNPSKGTTSVTVQEAYKNHPIFEGITVAEDGTCVLFDTSDTGNNQMQAYSVATGSPIENDPVLAKIGDNNAIHIHGTDVNLYALIPVSSDALAGNFSDNGVKLILNTTDFLIATKFTPTETVATPEIVATQKDKTVEVVITCATEGATIYYTLDGSTPTSSSIEYTAPFEIAGESAVINAIALKAGMTTSEIDTENVENTAYVAKNNLLGWTNFRDQPADWGASGDIIAAGTKDTEAIRGTFIVSGGSQGQRMNLQTTGASLVIGADYGPASIDAVGATSWGLKFLKANNGGYIVTPEAYAGPFDVSLWWTGAKGASYTENMTVSVKTADAETWTDLGTVSTSGNKKIVKSTVTYTGTETVYVRVMSTSGNGNNNDAVIFDLAVVGEGNASVAATPVIADEPSGVKQTVTISSESAYAAIYYTTDGSEPTAESTPYAGAFEIEASSTVKAIAYRAGLVVSEVASKDIVIGSVGIDAEYTDKVVADQVYITPAGVEMKQPVAGVNIVKTTYEDGTVVMTKVVIK